MAGYICQYLGRVNEAGQWENIGFVPWLKIGDANCIYESIEQAPRWLMGFETDFDEPVSAVEWHIDQLRVKPDESDRGYAIRQTSFYPELLGFMYNTSPVYAALLEAVLDKLPVELSKEAFLKLKGAVDATRAEQAAKLDGVQENV